MSGQYLLKLAKKPESEGRGKGIAAVVGGGLIARKAYDPIMGQTTLYHGTPRKNWKGIKEKGLLGSMGGQQSGATAALDRSMKGASPGVKEELKNVRGHVYAAKSKAGAIAMGVYGSEGSGRLAPKVIDIKIPDSEYHSDKWKPDEAWSPTKDKSRKSIAVRKRGNVGTESFRNDIGSRFNRFKNLAKNHASYRKGSGKRLGKGLLALGAGLGLAGYGASKLGPSKTGSEKVEAYRFITEEELIALSKEAWVNKVIPKKFTGMRNGVAGGLKKIRKKTEPVPGDSKMKVFAKKNIREATRSASLHADVGALYIGTTPIPGFPSGAATAAYSKMRKPIAKKMKAAFAPN